MKTPRAGVYTRISSDDGTALGVQRQRHDCVALAGKLGWDVVEVYTDNDTSNFTAKRRPSYERMLADLENGRINALVVWDTDRLTRRPVELEHVIEIADRRGISLASVGGEVDLATAQGRLTARIKASVSRHEVEQSSRRIKRAVLERAEAGRPHGRVAYGWRRIQGRDVLDAEEAAVVEEIAKRIVSGESVRSIAHDLVERAIPSPNGLASWHPVMVRQVVLRERNAGFRRHQGKVIGKGDWEPILSEQLYARVCSILRDPLRRTSPTGRHRHLLSGIARCGACNGTLRVVTVRGRTRAYACPTCFKVRRRQAPVDELITNLVTAKLAQPDALAAFVRDEDDHAGEEVAALRAQLDLVADQFANDEIDGTQLTRITARLRQRLADAQARLAVVAPDLSDLATPEIDSVWTELPVERKRAVINLLLKSVTVLPIGRGQGNTFRPESVTVEWRAGSSTS